MYLLTENTKVSMYLYVHLLKIYNEWILFLLFYIKKKQIKKQKIVEKIIKNIIKKMLQLFMLLVGWFTTNCSNLKKTQRTYSC